MDEKRLKNPNLSFFEPVTPQAAAHLGIHLMLRKVTNDVPS